MWLLCVPEACPTCAVSEEQQEESSPGHGVQSHPGTSELGMGRRQHLLWLSVTWAGAGPVLGNLFLVLEISAPPDGPAEVCS